MSTLMDALRRKYRTPHEAMAALGLDASLLTIPQQKELNMPKIALSRTAVRVQSALTAHMFSKLAQDGMPKFEKALAPILKGVTAKNLKAKKAAIWAGAKDAAIPLMTPEAQASGGVGPDDVMLKILDLVGAQGAAEPAELDAPPAVDPAAVDPAADPTEEGDEPDENADVKAALQGLLSPEDFAKISAMLDASETTEASAETPEDKTKNEEAEDAELKAKDRKAWDAKHAKDKEPPMIAKPAMDAAIAKAKTEVRAEAVADMTKRLKDIRAAEKAVFPLIGEISVAMDSADAIYTAALKANDVSTAGVDPSAFPAMVALLARTKVEGAKPRLRLAHDAALVSDRLAFDKEHGIISRPIRNLGAA
jgi:hypothetical protein